jgi:stage II sporulation protein D
VRFAVGRQLGWNLLRSERFDIRPANDRLVFEGSGSGHGVGLCQRGADLMGAAGRSYREILAFYYPGTVVGLSGSGLRWQRLAGNTVSLLTVRPDQDRVVLAIAERLLRSLEERTHWTAPAGLEVRAYPDLESFRNATAEPGWVAGHTEGRRVHLQPVPALRARGLLESVLHHELAHVLLEAHAAPGLPLWFREGLAGYLARPARAAAARIPSESDLRQIGDPARARRAYEDAAASVSNLVQRHGEGMVLGWVSSGLPREKEVTAEAPRHREGGK